MRVIEYIGLLKLNMNKALLYIIPNIETSLL